MRQTSLVVLTIAAVAVATTACAPSAEPQASTAAPPTIAHVHGIESAPASDDILVATHHGLYRLAEGGRLDGPIGGDDFDAMGFTVVDGTMFASGHPGERTPPELGSPNLGIIRSDDGGTSWSPVAFTGESDFHVLTAGPDGTLYGIPTHAPELLSSRDGGMNWSAVAAPPAVDLVATEQGLVAATEQGLQVSADRGETFAPIEGAPLLYSVDASSTGALIGVDTSSAVQRQRPDGGWEQVGSVEGVAAALSVVGGDRILLADDRGIVELTEDGAVVLSPAS